MASSKSDDTTPVPGERLAPLSVPDSRNAAQNWLGRSKADAELVADIKAIVALVEQTAAVSGHGLSRGAAIAKASVLQCLAAHAEVTAAAEAVHANANDATCEELASTVNRLQMAVWTCAGAAIDLGAFAEALSRSPFAQTDRLTALAAKRASWLVQAPQDRPQFHSAAALQLGAPARGPDRPTSN